MWPGWRVTTSEPILPPAGWLPLLESHDCGAVEDIHAVFVGPGRHVPARVRVLLDFLAERVAQDLA